MRSQRGGQGPFAPMLLLIGLGVVGAIATGLPGGSLEAMFNRDCVIKGNVSIVGGERIYHVPGGEFYDETVINPRYGERWFCSEQEARAAGWRRSLR